MRRRIILRAVCGTILGAEECEKFCVEILNGGGDWTPLVEVTVRVIIRSVFSKYGYRVSTGLK
jgi:hypothetical protein